MPRVFPPPDGFRRFQLNVPTTLLARARKAAIDQDETLSHVVVAALERYAAEHGYPTEPGEVVPTTRRRRSAG